MHTARKLKNLKKTGIQEKYEEVYTDINWAEYMVCAREMGMSEEEFMHSCPIFFNECYRIFLQRKREEVKALYGK